MDNIKISVVIPVYNVENYLKQCLDSIIKSSYKNIEIICVNDGSTDNSLKILEEYRQIDNRIIVISQENKGLSGARNSGLKIAQGDYIYFLDSDDWVSVDLIEKAFNEITNKNADVLVFGTYNVYLDSIIENKRKITNFIKKFKTTCCYYNDNKAIYTQSCTAWTKFFRKNFLTKNNLFFQEDVRFSEDAVFWSELLLSNPKIALLDECLYYYRVKRTNALTSTKNSIMQKQWNAYLFLKQLDLYKNVNEFDKLIILDFFTISMMCHYSDIENIRNFLDYESALKDVNKEFKLYKKNNLLKLSGYRQLRLRWVYTIAKKIVLNILKLKNKRIMK